MVARHEDERGYFEELMSLYVEAQRNRSFSKAGVLRGLHYQIGSPQVKQVKLESGMIRDVVVDIRTGEIRKKDMVAGDSMVVGMHEAHGFYAFEDSEVYYWAVPERVVAWERVIRWDDKDLKIEWGNKGKKVILSERDKAGMSWEEAKREYEERGGVK